MFHSDVFGIEYFSFPFQNDFLFQFLDFILYNSFSNRQNQNKVFWFSWNKIFWSTQNEFFQFCVMGNFEIFCFHFVLEWNFVFIVWIFLQNKKIGSSPALVVCIKKHLKRGLDSNVKFCECHEQSTTNLNGNENQEGICKTRKTMDVKCVEWTPKVSNRNCNCKQCIWKIRAGNTCGREHCEVQMQTGSMYGTSERTCMMRSWKCGSSFWQVLIPRCSGGMNYHHWQVNLHCFRFVLDKHP